MAVNTESTSQAKYVGGPYNGADGVILGQSGDYIGFYGATPVVKRGNASQAAVGTTAATATTPYGFSTAAQADSIVTLVNEIRATLVALGLMKGSA